jgi:hypothetical protein
VPFRFILGFFLGPGLGFGECLPGFVLSFVGFGWFGGSKLEFGESMFGGSKLESIPLGFRKSVYWFGASELWFTLPLIHSLLFFPRLGFGESVLGFCLPELRSCFIQLALPLNRPLLSLLGFRESVLGA